jgi:23S rRNA (guanine1835-N2)-methyltransferase
MKHLPLKRYPVLPKETLQAWDSADDLILEHLNELDLNGKRLLIMNDQFGALSVPLSKHDITTYTDSYLSFRAIQNNSDQRITPITSFGELKGEYDLALLRIPKNMSFFEDMLCHLTEVLKPGARVICGYMVKHQSKASFELLNKRIGKTSTSLAKKKARLIFADFSLGKTSSPYPLQVSIEGFQKPFLNHSNLFSREKLDIGTRFLLENIPKGAYRSILDLGCGNGVIGIAAKKSNPKATLVFADESKMAIESARVNYERIYPDAEPARYRWTHCYEGEEPDSLELVICNPPFHQGTTLGDSVAKEMFKDAHHALVKGGVMRVIGNFHLHHESALKRIFGNSRIVARNDKFTIVDAVK